MDRAAELRQQLRAAWSEMSIPKLRPPPEDGYLDYRDTYPAVNGQRWEDLNLGPTGELMPLWNDCWIEDLFEAEAKIYYFAAFLDYCLKFYSHSAGRERQFWNFDSRLRGSTLPAERG